MPERVERGHQRRKIGQDQMRTAPPEGLGGMIAPFDAQRMGAGRPGHLDVVAGVADQHRVGGPGPGRPHRAMQHFGMGLGGRVVGRLQRDEIMRQAMAFERMGKAALRLAGGDTEQQVAAPVQRLDRRPRAGEQRLGEIGALADFEKGIAVARRDAAAEARLGLRQQRRQRLVEREADDREHLRARQFGQPVRGKGMRHRRHDHVLAVDQRAVAIEDDEAARRGHPSNPRTRPRRRALQARAVSSSSSCAAAARLR